MKPNGYFLNVTKIIGPFLISYEIYFHPPLPELVPSILNATNLAPRFLLTAG